MILSYTQEVRSDFPDLMVVAVRLEGVKVAAEDLRLEEFKKEVYERAKSKYSIESVKDEPLFRRYRDFFWRIGTDPTKNRPASEALARRILAGKPLPRINTLVDAYNLASVESAVPLAAFDAGKMEGSLLMRRAKDGEEFLGIGMSEPMKLSGKEVVLQDDRKLVAVYPYRDADYSKITPATTGIILLACGAPGIGEDALDNAASTAIEYITRFCGGKKTN